MVAINPDARMAFDGCEAVSAVNRLTQRVRYDFDLYAVLAREKQLLESGRAEIRFYEPTKSESWIRPAAPNGEEANRGYVTRPPLTTEDIRLHAWLTDRLLVLYYQRHGLRPRLRRLLFGNRLIRWLGKLDRPPMSDVTD